MVLLNFILHKKPIAYNIIVRRRIIVIMESKLLYNKSVALLTLFDSSKKVYSANNGKESTVLKKIAEEIQNAGDLERDCASVF